MFSVFYKDVEAGETEFKFQSIMINKKTDVFVKSAIENMGWNKDNIKLYTYENDEIKFRLFVKHMDSQNSNEKIFVDEDGTFKKILITKERDYVSGGFPFDHKDSLKYYTQEEIDNHLANEIVSEAWITANTVDGVFKENPEPVAPPLQFPTIHPVQVDRFIMSEEESTIIDSINGTLVNINEKIAQEEAIINGGV